MLTFPARRGTPPSYSKLLLADLVKWWNGSYIILLSLEAGKWILPAPIVSLRLYLCTTHLYWPPSLQARHLQKSMKRRPWSHKCIISSPLGPLGNLATEEGAWDLYWYYSFQKRNCSTSRFDSQGRFQPSFRWENSQLRVTLHSLALVEEEASKEMRLVKKEQERESSHSPPWMIH